MSMVTCDECGEFIDSDDDPDCFVEVQRLNMQEKVWCETCREEQDDERGDAGDVFAGVPRGADAVVDGVF